jgi:hypothetical protein
MVDMGATAGIPNAMSGKAQGNPDPEHDPDVDGLNGDMTTCCGNDCCMPLIQGALLIRRILV